MNRRLLLAIVALAAIGVGLFLFLDGDDKKKAAEPPKTADNTLPTRDVPDSLDHRNVPDRQQPGQVTPSTAEEAGEYMLEDGTMVRDHRSGGSAPYVKPSVPHREASPVTANVTSNVMRAVRPIVLKCMSNVPDSAFGKAPLIETRASISIDAEGNLTVLELGPALADIDEGAVGDALDCIRNAAASIHVHVDHEEVAQTTLAFAIRPLDHRRNAD